MLPEGQWLLCLRLVCSVCVQGKPSRSLQAAFKLMDEAGLTADDVVHLERGMYGWYQAELPIVGELSPYKCLCYTLTPFGVDALSQAMT